MKDLQAEIARYRIHMPLPLRWSDMDELGHVNNSVFLTYLEEARIYFLEKACHWDWRRQGIIVARIEIDYLRPLHYKFPATAYTRCSRLGEKSFDLEYLIVSQTDKGEVAAAKAKTIMVAFDYTAQASRVLGEEERRTLGADLA